MRLLNRVAVLGVAILFTLITTGCQWKVYKQTEGNVADATVRTKAAFQKSDNDAKPQPSLVVKSGLYVDQTPINLAKEPSWLKNYVVIRGEDLPFTYYTRVIVNGGDQNGQLARVYRDFKASGSQSMAAFIPPPPQGIGQGHTTVLTRYQVGLDPTLKLSINYSGTVKGALDMLASKTGYVYSINGSDVYWQAFVTKTFEIAFMPGTSDYMMGKASAGGAGAGTAPSGGMQQSSGFIDDSAASQYSNIKGTLSIWKDLDTTIKQLLTPDGKVIVSESTTSVTVKDRPSNVDLVSKYIANLNRHLSSQVLVKVEVLDISLSNDFNFGINWQAVQNKLGKGSDLILNANYGTPITIQNFSGGPNPTMGFQRHDSSSSYLAPLISALQQQGKVAVVSQPRVVCLNNQVSAIRIVSQQGYLASLQITSFGGSSTTPATAQSNSVTSQITPGQVVTGLTLYILPKIIGNKIVLQVNADLSLNNGFGTVTATGQPSTAANPQSAIQVPNLTQKQFNQRSVISSGETLVLSGFRQVTNNAAAQQFLDSTDLGGRAATQQNNETIVLITPIILHGCA